MGGGSADMQASVDCHDDPSHSQRNCIANGSSTAARGLSAVASNGSSSESGHPTVSRACERVFCGLLMSGKFASLCKLLSENFQGLKVEKLLDFSLVNTRIKGGVYEHTPMLFSSDIQQVLCLLNTLFIYKCLTFVEGFQQIRLLGVDILRFGIFIYCLVV